MKRIKGIMKMLEDLLGNRFGLVALVAIFTVTCSAQGAETPSWLRSLQNPVAAPVRFYGSFSAYGTVTVSLAGVPSSITNNFPGGVCGSLTTPLKEVELQIYKTYSLSFSGAKVGSSGKFVLRHRKLAESATYDENPDGRVRLCVSRNAGAPRAAKSRARSAYPDGSTAFITIHSKEQPIWRGFSLREAFSGVFHV